MDSILKRFNESRDDDLELPLVRTKLDEKYDQNEDFALDYKDRAYDRQYFLMYQYRLNELRNRVAKNCTEKWNSGFKLQGRHVVRKQKVLDIQANEPCWCIGAIYCEMKYKPNILEEVAKDTYGAPDLTKSYTDPEGSDEIMLEDESGRVLLVGDVVTSTPFVSGTVVGILGMEADAGTFQVLDICYPYPLPQSKPVLPTSCGKIALISGLNITPDDPKLSLKLQLLQNYLMGEISDPVKSKDIAKLIICGDSVALFEEEGKLISSLEQLSDFLTNILQSIPVDIMPGENDPSDKSLPQQPLHKALFSGALESYFHDSNQNVFNPTTNPSWFNISGVKLLGTSGQNVNDIYKYIIPYYENSKETLDNDIEHRLDMIEATLNWQNIAPTAPDTLWCYPYKDNDPFILKEWPRVYFVGNQPEYGTRKVTLDNDTRIKTILVPKFSSTGQIVVLDLKTLESELVTITV